MLWTQPVTLFPIHFTTIQSVSCKFFQDKAVGNCVKCFAEVLARNIHCSHCGKRSDQVSLAWLDFVKPILAFPHCLFICFLIIYRRTCFITFPGIEVRLPSLSLPGPLLSPFCRWVDICLLPVMRDIPWSSQLIKCYRQRPWNSARHFLSHLVVDSVQVHKLMWIVSSQEITALSIFHYQCVNVCVIAYCFCDLGSNSTGKDSGKEDTGNLPLVSSISDISLPV